jgi:hypothetical protein
MCGEEDQIVGMTRLLTIALRLLTLVEMQVRTGLAKDGEKLAGLYGGQESRKTGQPTATRMLKVISRMNLSLTRIDMDGRVAWHVTDIPPLLERILRLLGLTPSIYTNLAFHAPGRETSQKMKL